MKQTFQSLLGQKWFLPPLFAFALFVLTGCIASVYPLYNEENLTFNNDLLGVYGENDKETWTFEKRDEKSYDLTIKDDETVSKMVCRLVKIEDRMFLDLTMNEKTFEERKLDTWTYLSLVPGHIFMKVESIRPLKLGLLKGDWIKDRINEDPKFISHVKFETEPKLAITATTAELQKFVLEHWNNEKAWDIAELKAKK